jgi:hypothetical protein
VSGSKNEHHVRYQAVDRYMPHNYCWIGNVWPSLRTETRNVTTRRTSPAFERPRRSRTSVAPRNTFDNQPSAIIHRQQDSDRAEFIATTRSGEIRASSVERPQDVHNSAGLKLVCHTSVAETVDLCGSERSASTVHSLHT